MAKPLSSNPSKRALYMRAWREKHPENFEYMRRKNNEYGADPSFAAANRERVKAHRDADPELAKARKAANHQKHREKRYETAKKYRAARADLVRERSRQYAHVRRARKRQSEIGEINFAAVLEQSCGLCGICGGQIGQEFHYDHIIPLAVGGGHVEGNIQIAHPRCNRFKGAKTDFKPVAPHAA